MARIQPGTYHDYKNGEVVVQEFLNTDLEITRTAVNDNYDRIEAHRSASVIDHPDGSITAAKLAPGAVTLDKLPDQVITGAKIANSAISTSKLADNSVTEPKIQTNAVITRHIMDGNVTREKLQDSSIDSSKIQSVTGAKILANTIPNSALVNATIQAEKIADHAIATNKLAPGAVTTDRISDRAVTAGKLDTNSVTADKIAAAAVGTDKLASQSVTSAKIAQKTITGALIADGAIGNNHLGLQVVKAANILDSTITRNQILDGTLDYRYYTESEIDAKLASIVAGQIPANTITDAQIGPRTVDQATLVEPSNTGTLTELLSLLAKVMKSVTGNPNWYQNAVIPLTEAMSKNKFLFGTGNFSGSVGTIITHNVGNLNYVPIIVPVENTLGYLGEVWVEQAATNMKVCCSGQATQSFRYLIVVAVG